MDQSRITRPASQDEAQAEDSETKRSRPQMVDLTQKHIVGMGRYICECGWHECTVNRAMFCDCKDCATYKEIYDGATPLTESAPSFGKI